MRTSTTGFLLEKRLANTRMVSGVVWDDAERQRMCCSDGFLYFSTRILASEADRRDDSSLCRSAATVNKNTHV